jgi:transposase
VGSPHIWYKDIFKDMDNKTFYTQLLGIHNPWYIREVSLDTKAKRVDVYIEHVKGVRFPCPDCEEFCGVYDHTEEREFRHLNTCQMTTWLHIKVPRINCKEHGVQQVIHGLAEKNGGFTYEFESLALDIQQECNVQSVCRLLDIDWHTCWQMQSRAVKRGFSRKTVTLPERIGVDEKAFAKGHKYETLIYDIEKKTVEYVCESRTQESLESYYKQFSQAEREKVKSISMDMWDPYIAATKAYIPESEKKIVFDRFHVMKMVVDAVDKVRKNENKELKQEGINLLKSTRYLWLWSQENIPEWRREEFEELRSKDLKVCRAWVIKENLRHLWSYYSESWMRKYFIKWYKWAIHSRLEPIMKAAQTLKRHIDNIVTYSTHQITNALGESLNAKIEKVRRLACGYRNRENYRTAIYFHCGGLELYPKRTNIAFQVIRN